MKSMKIIFNFKNTLLIFQYLAKKPCLAKNSFGFFTQLSRGLLMYLVGNAYLNVSALLGDGFKAQQI